MVSFTRCLAVLSVTWTRGAVRGRRVVVLKNWNTRGKPGPRERGEACRSSVAREPVRTGQVHLIPVLYDRALDLVLPCKRFPDMINAVKAVLRAQPFIDLHPGAGNGFAHFTNALVNAAAGPIEQSLGTAGNRADSTRISDNTITTGTASFFINADIPVDADGNGIDGRKNRNLRVNFRQQLYTRRRRPWREGSRTA